MKLILKRNNSINTTIKRIREKENFTMKKTLLLLGILTTMFIGARAFAACPCTDPCPAQPCCPTATCPTQPCCPAAACPCQTTCGCPCCDDATCAPKCKCTWWKIFEDKTCCYKCNNECSSCLSAKRAHWWKFWTDRCVVKNVKCDKCNKCCD